MRAAPRRCVRKTDDAVWAVTCLLARAGFRRRGSAGRSPAPGSRSPASGGARAIGAYPIIAPRAIAEELHVGTPGVFGDAGLVEVSRPSPRRVVMRLDF